MLRLTDLLTHENSNSPISEAYKTLRTNIQFSFAEGGLKTILITSSNPFEGKSTTAVNLAITMAQSDLRVLLVDCDLRKPVLHRAFSLLNGEGLTNILVEGTDYNKLVNRTAIENLEVITSGPKPPNPSEILGSARMKTLVDLLKENYDMILLDSPPALPVTDAAVLSKLVDGVILVAEYGQTTYESISQTMSILGKVNAKLLGAILNRVPANGRNYYYYQEDQGDNKKNSKKPKSARGRS